MHSTSARRIRDLSLWLAIALAIQAAGGLWIPGLYRDNSWITSTYRATDSLALFLVAPALAISARFAFRGSARAELVRLGLVYKIFYNNFYFLFGTAFNRFFLLYVAIAVLSATALAVSIRQLDARTIEATIESNGKRRFASGILFAFGLLLLGLWTGQSLQFVLQGVLPGIITATGGPTHLVAALDLTLVVPCMLPAAWRLWRNRRWGVALSAAALVQGFFITLDLMLASPFQDRAGIADAWSTFPLWAAMFAGFAAGTAAVLAPNTKTGDLADEPESANAIFPGSDDLRRV